MMRWEVVSREGGDKANWLQKGPPKLDNLKANDNDLDDDDNSSSMRLSYSI